MAARLQLFEKKTFLAYVEKAPKWMPNTIATYSGNPYQHLDEMLSGCYGNCGQGPTCYQRSVVLQKPGKVRLTMNVTQRARRRPVRSTRRS